MGLQYHLYEINNWYCFTLWEFRLQIWDWYLSPRWNTCSSYWLCGTYPMDRKSVLFWPLNWAFPFMRAQIVKGPRGWGMCSWCVRSGELEGKAEMEVVWWGWGYCPIWTYTKEILMNLIPPSFSLAIVRLNINSQDSNHQVETHTRGMECESSMYTQMCVLCLPF